MPVTAWRHSVSPAEMARRESESRVFTIIHIPRTTSSSRIASSALHSLLLAVQLTSSNLELEQSSGLELRCLLSK